MMNTCLAFEGTGVGVVVVVVVVFGVVVVAGDRDGFVISAGAGVLVATGAGGAGRGGRTTRSTRGRRSSARACDCALVLPSAVAITNPVARIDTAPTAHSPARVSRTSRSRRR